MWLPILFAPSKESQAAGRAFVARIQARTEDRDTPVSAETIAAYRAAANGWGSAPPDDFAYLSRIAQPTLVVNGSNDVVIPTINSYHLYQQPARGRAVAAARLRPRRPTSSTPRFSPARSPASSTGPADLFFT